MTKKCPLLWSHVRMHVDGTVLPCCVFDDNEMPNKNISIPKISDGIDAAFNSELFNDVRERMMLGEELPECHRCWHTETTGNQSLRLESFDGFGKFIGNGKIRYIETALSTHCNLACRMCNETFSSKWKLINNPGMSVDTAIDNFRLEYYDGDLSGLKLIKIVGGEPLIDKNHTKFLQMLFDKSDNPKNIILYYNTNGTVHPNKDILNFWEKVNKVIMVFSIDGVGELNEIIRPPHKWATIQETINRFKSFEKINFDLRMHSVISVLNVKHLKDVVKFSIDNFNQFPEFDLLTYPQHLSLQHINYKNEILDFIHNNYSQMTDKLSYLTDFINKDTDKNYSKEYICNIENRITEHFKTRDIKELL
jgi:MoaA/NifB/PqqE/SkfB family radical SAM enzyme